MMEEMVSKQLVIDTVHKIILGFFSEEDGVMTDTEKTLLSVNKAVCNGVRELPSAQPEQCKFEYHYDHTDCIWYRPEARNRCPATCAQYRDGWNDAMNYIFRDGKGYRPYRRDKQYGE